MTPLEEIYKCIDESKSFVLQGGAGSGKTESLKQTLQYIAEKYPDKNVACITHTNLAADEIKERVGEGFKISTIHSFLNSLIKNYKINIHQVIFELFKLEHINRLDIEHYEDEKEQNKKEHEKYKKIYKSYASKLFTVKKVSAEKVIGKRDYDKNPTECNEILNKKIDELNSLMKQEIKDKNFTQIEYNDTQFDDYHSLTYGHDGLLQISHLLFKKYSKLKQILQDKYDYILIDEYQDTNENIIDIFMEINIGLFGDSMQSIYEDGIGDVQKYIDSSKLEEIFKEDNYRCSYEVVNFINNLRDDKLKQEVALKNEENEDDRKGNVQFYYSIYDNKPNVYSKQEDKDKYVTTLNTLIKKISNEEVKTLMLTNKAIAKEVGFENLYNIFNARYRDPKEYMDKVLKTLQFEDLFELCDAFINKKYNFVLGKLKKNCFAIKSISDKKKISDTINEIITSEMSAAKTIEKAFTSKLIGKAEKFDEYQDRKRIFIKAIEDNKKLQNFKIKYNEGNSTFTKMKKILDDLEEEVFNEYEREIKKEAFYKDLFSDKINFSEILNYFKYINEKTNYITMHKTKGSSIKNVVVVLEEYFWNEYKFKVLYEQGADEKMKKKMKKLFYVACSRTEKNLSCVRLITSEEENDLLNLVTNAQKIELE